MSGDMSGGGFVGAEQAKQESPRGERECDGYSLELIARPEGYILERRWTSGGELLTLDRFPIPSESCGYAPGSGVALISTTRGELPIYALQRETVVTDNDNETSVVFTWRIEGEVVRRSAHVILKKAGVVATGVAAAFAP